MDFPEDLVEAIELRLNGFKSGDTLDPLRLCEDIHSANPELTRGVVSAAIKHLAAKRGIVVLDA
jgi:hypothetical protein